jgi:hypothetical protein
MTKAELLTAITGVPDDATVFVDPEDGVWRSGVKIYCEQASDGDWDIVIGFDEIEAPGEDDVT